MKEELQAPFKKVTGPQSYRLNGLKRTEFQHEYDPKGGEIASQVKGHEIEHDKKLSRQKYNKDAIMPSHVYRAMKTLSRSPGLVRQKMTGKEAGRENYSKEKIRQKDVMNTDAKNTWEKAKKTITPERIGRAEANRKKTQTSPTILRVKDPTDRSGKKSTEWTIGGNTRLSSMPEKGGKTPTQVIKMKEEIANVSAGVPGTGVTPEGKPQGFGDTIVNPKAAKTWKKMNAMLRRRSPVMEQEQIDELSRKTLSNYIKKASDNRAKNQGEFDFYYKKKNSKKYGKAFRNVINRRKGIRTATDKLVKESATMAALAAGSALGAAAAPHINKAVGKGLDWLEKKRKQKHQDHYDKKSRRIVKEETFAGAVVFEVSAHTFHNAKMEKRKGKHWRTYLDECDELSEIRQYANKHPKKAIVLQNRNTNEMVYVRYGKDR